MTHIEPIRGRYLDENVVREELQKIFPNSDHTKLAISYRRGRFHCSIPRALTKDELSQVYNRIERYQKLEEAGKGKGVDGEEESSEEEKGHDKSKTEN